MTEEDLQKTVADWLDWNMERRKFMWFHVPNGGHMSRVVQTKKGPRRVSFLGKKRKRMGAKPGVPDIVIMFEGGDVLQIELKPPKKGLSKEQRRWRNRSDKLAIPYEVCRSLEDVQFAVEVFC